MSTSGLAECGPAFSPDGQYLLIGTNFHVTGPFGSLFYLKVIPADGRLYDVTDGEETEGVITIQAKGSRQPEAADEEVYWR